MKVKCSGCNAAFNIKDEKVPASGAKIKCPKCQSVILITKPQPAPPAVSSSPADENAGGQQSQAPAAVAGEKMNCPYCAEEILSVATKCKHCGGDVVDNQPAKVSGGNSVLIKKGRSIVPMILGIIGGVIGLPGALCAGACAVGLGSLAGEGEATAQAMGDFYLYLGIITALAGLIFGCLAKRKPVLSGIVMIACAILGGITIIVGNMFALVASILFLIGGGIAIANKNRPVAIAA